MSRECFRIFIIGMFILVMIPFAAGADDEPAWPSDFDAKVAELVSQTVPSGSQISSASVEPFSFLSRCAVSDGVGTSGVPFDSCFRVVRESSGGNMSSYPVGSVICIR